MEGKVDEEVLRREESVRFVLDAVVCCDAKSDTVHGRTQGGGSMQGRRKDSINGAAH